jgi:hypothetical protein
MANLRSINQQEHPIYIDIISEPSLISESMPHVRGLLLGIPEGVFGLDVKAANTVAALLQHPQLITALSANTMTGMDKRDAT